MAIASDYVAEALDKQLGGDVTDASIFRAHAAKYEVCMALLAKSVAHHARTARTHTPGCEI